MLDFRRQAPARSFLGQREQRRLLGLCIGIGLVMFAIREASQPNRWHWLIPPQAGPAAAEEPPQRPRARHPANLDGELLADAFVSPPEHRDEPKADQADERYFPGVRADYLKAVRDDTFLRRSEHDAWFHLLEILSKTDARTLREASLGRVTFVQLDDQPKEYRGRVVTVRGTVRQVAPFDAPKNPYGIRDYYQLAVLPEGGPAEPLIVYVLELPPQFPRGEKIAAEVELTGFFFKRWAYQAQDRPRVAPLILARSVAWQPPAPPPAAAAPDPAVLVPYLVGGLLIATAACVLFYVRSRRKAAERRARTTPELAPAALDALKDAELAPTTEQVLEQLTPPRATGRAARGRPFRGQSPDKGTL